jgi:hypothetical protein
MNSSGASSPGATGLTAPWAVRNSISIARPSLRAAAQGLGGKNAGDARVSCLHNGKNIGHPASLPSPLWRLL